MESPMGINNLNIKVSAPKSAPTSALSLGEFKPSPLGEIKESITVEPARKVNEVVYVPVLKDNKASQSKEGKAVETENPVEKNKAEKRRREIDEELEEQEEAKKEEENSEKAREEQNQQQYKRTIDIKTVAIRTGYLMSKLTGFMVFNSNINNPVKKLELSLVPPEGAPSADDDIFGLNRARSWQAIVNGLESSINADITGLISKGLFLLLTNIPYKMKEVKNTGAKNVSRGMSRLEIMTSSPKLSVRPR